MVACPRCAETLTPAEALTMRHECDDGHWLTGCPYLQTFVEEDYHLWLHDWARAFEAEIVVLTGFSGQPQPYLWRLG